MQAITDKRQHETLRPGANLQYLRSCYKETSWGCGDVDVIFGMRQASKEYEEIQGDPHFGHSITPYEIGVMALCGEMDIGNRVGYEWSKKLYAKRNEILHEE
jgi:hypothetical protein